MEKILLAVHYEREDYQRQELWDIEKECPIFGVSDLWECPEDAIIGRALHDAGDAFDLIEIGFKYASEGYTKINLIWENCPKDEELDDFAEEYIKKWKEAHT